MDPFSYVVETDGDVVWVHAATGHTIGRFGRMGIDVHTADASGCLHCTHGPTGPADWDAFVNAMGLHHDVEIGEEYRPARVGG